MDPEEAQACVQEIVDHYPETVLSEAQALNPEERENGATVTRAAVVSVLDDVLKEIGKIPLDISPIPEGKQLLLWLRLREYANQQFKLETETGPVHPRICAAVNQTLFAIAKIFELKDFPTDRLGLYGERPIA